MTIQEAADKLGTTVGAIYAKRHRRRPLGMIFKKNKFGTLECSAKDLKPFLALKKAEEAVK